MQALVVGGAGFVGSSLVERLLAEEWHVEVIDDLSTGSIDRLAAARADSSHTLRINRHDVTDPATSDLVERTAPDRVFFLADGSDEPDPVRRLEVGVVGLVRVLEGASRLPRPPKLIVTVAAADLHAAGADVGPINEDREPGGSGPGGAAARAALSALKAYRAGSSIEHTVLALADVYGPSMPSRAGLGAAMADAEHGKAVLDLRPYDLVHLDDTVDALVRAATRADGLLVHVSSGRLVDGSDLVDRLAGLGIEVRGGRVVEGAPLLDIGRAEIHLGWTPFTPLGEGLATLV